MSRKGLISKVNKVLLASVLVSACMISGTMAKYVTEVSASDSARVAKFAVKSPMDEEQEIDLFGTLYNTNGTEEKNVKSLNGDKVVAPGTAGSFDIVLENESEVSINYVLSIACDNLPNRQLQFSLDNKTWSSASIIPLTDRGNIYVNDETQSKTVTVYWRWEFERGFLPHVKADNNKQDTQLGLAGEAEVTATIKGTFTQID